MTGELFRLVKRAREANRYWWNKASVAQRRKVLEFLYPDPETRKIYKNSVNWPWAELDELLKNDMIQEGAFRKLKGTGGKQGGCATNRKSH